MWVFTCHVLIRKLKLNAILQTASIEAVPTGIIVVLAKEDDEAQIRSTFG